MYKRMTRLLKEDKYVVESGGLWSFYLEGTKLAVFRELTQLGAYKIDHNFRKQEKETTYLILENEGKNYLGVDAIYCQTLK